MSTVGAGRQPIASVVSRAGSTPGRGCDIRPHAIRRAQAARRCARNVGLLGEQPCDLGADDAAAEQRYPEHLARLSSRKLIRRPIAAGHPVSRGGRSPAPRHRPPPPRQGAAVVVVRGERPAVRPGRRDGEQSLRASPTAGSSAAPRCSPLSQCLPTTRDSIGARPRSATRARRYRTLVQRVRTLSLIPPVDAHVRPDPVHVLDRATS